MDELLIEVRRARIMGPDIVSEKLGLQNVCVIILVKMQEYKTDEKPSSYNIEILTNVLMQLLTLYDVNEGIENGGRYQVLIDE